MTSRVDPKLATAVLDAAAAHATTRLTGVDVHYISGTDTARLIRSALKLAFPGVPFRVRTQNYSGGASVNIDWTDGPTKAKVDAALSGFVGHHFDGMIDLDYSSDCYMTRAGTVGFAATHGTAGSGGSYPARSVPVPPDAAIVVFLPYIFTTRHYSTRLPADADLLRRRSDADLPPAPMNWKAVSV